MKKNPIKPADNATNQTNANKGTLGTNRQYDQVHGNRGTQKNLNQKGKSKHKLCSVTFLISEYAFEKIDLAANHLRVVTKEEAVERGLKTFRGYIALEFIKGIQPIAKGLNHSGALQRITKAIDGVCIRAHWQYWINDEPCIDEKHPGADYTLEYCPAIDGY